MSDEPAHKSYEWADALFSNKYDIAPKYRDMLAMLAASMMGNPGAAQHFYNQAIVDGASDEELHRVAQIAQSSQIEIGNLSTNVQEFLDKLRAEQDRSSDADAGEVESSPN